MPIPRVLFLAIALALLAVACGGGDGDNDDSTKIADATQATALTFAPDGRLFFAEQYTGVIRVISPTGELVSEPFADLDVADWLNLDWGLTGLAVPPDFDTNPYLYVFFTEPLPSSETEPIARPILARIEASTNTAGPSETLIGDFPETRLGHHGFRANGAIHFGPEGALYMTMGDYDYGKELSPNSIAWAQDTAEPVGKFLRVQGDGGAPADNPFVSDPDADDRVFAFGFARGADFTFRPADGAIFGTDATDSCEELNIIIAGGNYGWPDVGEFPFSDCNAGPGNKAVYLLAKPDTQPGQFLSFVGVSGMAYLTGGKYPEFGEGLLICEKDTGLMRRILLGGESGVEETANDVVVDDCTGSVAVSPDGIIYYTNDTEVRRIDPPEEEEAAD